MFAFSLLAVFTASVGGVSRKACFVPVVSVCRQEGHSSSQTEELFLPVSPSLPVGKVSAPGRGGIPLADETSPSQWL